MKKDAMKTLLLTMLVPLVVFCQSKDLNYLVVKGRAEVQIPVEYLEVSLSITTEGSSFKAANDSNRILIFKVLDALRRFTIPDSDFQTTNNSSYEQNYNKEVERRFAIHYTGILWLRNPKIYDSLFQTLVSLGNVAVNINGFHSSQHAYYRMLAYHKAVEAARREAEMLLKGSNQKVGKIIKLIQDNRDVFTQYDDIDKLLQGSSVPTGLPGIATAQAEGMATNTFRKKYFTELAEVTVIFDIE
jgi:uncharacterized protein YggE